MGFYIHIINVTRYVKPYVTPVARWWCSKGVHSELSAASQWNRQWLIQRSCNADQSRFLIWSLKAQGSMFGQTSWLKRVNTIRASQKRIEVTWLTLFCAYIENVRRFPKWAYASAVKIVMWSPWKGTVDIEKRQYKIRRNTIECRGRRNISNYRKISALITIIVNFNFNSSVYCLFG
jgi:hypothetical protein